MHRMAGKSQVSEHTCTYNFSNRCHNVVLRLDPLHPSRFHAHIPLQDQKIPTPTNLIVDNIHQWTNLYLLISTCLISSQLTARFYHQGAHWNVAAFAIHRLGFAVLDENPQWILILVGGAHVASITISVGWFSSEPGRTEKSLVFFIPDRQFLRIGTIWIDTAKGHKGQNNSEKSCRKVHPVLLAMSNWPGYNKIEKAKNFCYWYLVYKLTASLRDLSIITKTTWSVFTNNHCHLRFAL